MRYTIYGKTGVFDAERFIDVMQAFENFIRAAKSGGGENLKGNMAELADIGAQPSTSLVPVFPMVIAQPEQPVKARAALAFLLYSLCVDTIAITTKIFLIFYQRNSKKMHIDVLMGV